jgi:cytochrome c oxidase assembly protein subunit 15
MPTTAQPALTASFATSPAALRVATLVRRLALFGVLLGLIVVVLGAWVRLTDAGLGCPDWPGCYGHVTPAAAARHGAALEAAQSGNAFNEGKAWREMIHRYAASTLGLVVVLIAALAIARRRERPVGIGFALALLATILLQGALGAFTVWWLVKPLVVVLHLLGGLTTVSLLFWLWLDLRRRTGIVQPEPADAAAPEIADADHGDTAAGGRVQARLRSWGLVALAALGMQIALGGWTSSNYAAVSCPDVPRCQGAWWPAGMDYADAFVLWRGLDVNYTGGVLEQPARVAIHFTHRLGALCVTLVLLGTAVLALRRGRTTRVRRAGAWLIGALGLQLVIGVLMVLRAFPLPLATGHNAGAALLLFAVLALNRRLRDAPAAASRPAPA